MVYHKNLIKPWAEEHILTVLFKSNLCGRITSLFSFYITAMLILLLFKVKKDTAGKRSCTNEFQTQSRIYHVYTLYIAYTSLFLILGGEVLFRRLWHYQAYCIVCIDSIEGGDSSDTPMVRMKLLSV